MKDFTRRTMLKGSAVAAGAAAVGFNTLFGYNKLFAQGNGDDVPTILNLAATAETLACTHYWAAIVTDAITFDEAELAYMKAALDSELQHLEFLNASGGAALTNSFFTPIDVYKDRAKFAAISEVAETAFVAAYLAATRRAAELNNPLLAMTAAQVAGVEAQHLAFVRKIGNLLPNNISLAKPLFYHVHDAVPTLTPFLEGGEGFEGPTKYPGADEIRKVIGDSGLESVLPAVDPNAFKA